MRTGQRARETIAALNTAAQLKRNSTPLLEPCCAEVSQPDQSSYICRSEQKTEAEQGRPYLIDSRHVGAGLPSPSTAQKLESLERAWRTESCRGAASGRASIVFKGLSLGNSALLNQRVRGNHFRVLAELGGKGPKATLADATF